MWTYFIQAQPDGNIKIGKTTRTPVKRMADMRTMAPVDLKLVACLEGDFERSWHLSFSLSRSHGEWFFPTKQLVDAIVKSGGIELARKHFKEFFAHPKYVVGDHAFWPAVKKESHGDPLWDTEDPLFTEFDRIITNGPGINSQADCLYDDGYDSGGMFTHCYEINCVCQGNGGTDINTCAFMPIDDVELLVAKYWPFVRAVAFNGSCIGVITSTPRTHGHALAIKSFGSASHRLSLINHEWSVDVLYRDTSSLKWMRINTMDADDSDEDDGLEHVVDCCAMDNDSFVESRDAFNVDMRTTP